MSIIFYMKADAEKATDEISFTDLNKKKITMIAYMKEGGKIEISRNDIKEKYFSFLDKKIETKSILEKYALTLYICTLKHKLQYEEYAKVEMQKQCTTKEMKIINSVVLEAI